MFTYLQSPFSHPDYTVGSGITPDQPIGSRALPPVGNYTLPRRGSSFFIITNIAQFYNIINYYLLRRAEIVSPILLLP